MNSNIPNIFVGTMECGEGDFESCKNKINSQSGVNVTHCIISGYSEKDAHNKLWESWNSVKEDFDYFVKIDADTVLIRDNILRLVFDTMSLFGATGMQVPIYDFYTDKLISGMNCFSPDVIFKETKDELFCDRVDTNHKKEIKGSSVPSALVPCARHCFESTNEQSFHFGVHRMLKNQKNIIQDVKIAWNKSRDVRRSYCLIGATMVTKFGRNDFNYCDSTFNDIFNDVVDNFDQYCEDICDEI